MPGTLLVVVILLASSIVLNVLGAAFVAAGIQGALLFGVLIGNDGVRTFLRGLAAVSILLSVILGAPALQATNDPMVLLMIVVGVAGNGYVIWALGRADVREWMFRKSFNLGGESGPEDDQIPKL
jgi:hypothetical protein